MAIRIFESNELPVGGMQALKVPFAVTQAPGTVSTSSTQSSAFALSTRVVTIQSDSDCYITFGASPTATSSGFLLNAGATWSFGVNGGDKVAWLAA